MKESNAILKLEKVDSGYGKKQVLNQVSLEVETGKITALIGPNGSGKSTVLKTVCGLLPVWNPDGGILFKGKPIDGNKPSANIQCGITFSPQGNQVFNRMTVLENLEIGGFLMPKPEMRERMSHVLEMYPALKSRLKQLAGTLSGGEQQMLALARALMPQPKLLLLDEPSLGLSPALVADVFKNIVQLNENNGLTILIVEQRVREVLKISEHVFALRLGTVCHSGKASELAGDRSLLREVFL